jgi:hypothetical protein
MSSSRMSDDDEAVHHPICRGCAGNGLGQHVSPRDVQLLGEMRWHLVAPPAGVERTSGRRWTRRDRFVTLSSVRYDRRIEHCTLLAPLLLCIRDIEQLESEGFQWDAFNPLRPAMEMCCTWCNGTGKRQLSVAMMRQAVMSRASR